MNHVKKIMISGLVLLSFTCAIAAQEDCKQSSYYQDLAKFDQLQCAIEELDTQTIKDLLKEVDVNSKDERGRTPLHNAIPDGKLEIVKLLVESGADVNAENSYGTTPLLEVYCSLIEGISMVYADDMEEAMPKDYFMEYIFIAQYLVDSGADTTRLYSFDGVFDATLVEIVTLGETAILHLLESHSDMPERAKSQCDEMIKYIDKFQAILQV